MGFGKEHYIASLKAAVSQLSVVSDFVLLAAVNWSSHDIVAASSMVKNFLLSVYSLELTASTTSIPNQQLIHFQDNTCCLFVRFRTPAFMPGTYCVNMCGNQHL